MKKLTAKKKGNLLEKEIKKIAKKHKFLVLTNLYIGYKVYHKQKYVEIDLVLLSKQGIIVVEAKNYNCLISGDLLNNYLKTVYPSGKSYSLYNPYQQNQSHIKHLSKYIKNENLFSLIVFSDDAELHINSLDKIDGELMQLDELNEFLLKFKNKKEIFTDKKINSIHKKLLSRTKVSKTVKSRHKKQVKKNKKIPYVILNKK